VGEHLPEGRPSNRRPLRKMVFRYSDNRLDVDRILLGGTGTAAVKVSQRHPNEARQHPELDHAPGVRAQWHARNCVRRWLIAARWPTVLSWRTVLRRRAIAGCRPISVRRGLITKRWSTVAGRWAIAGRRPISVRRWPITRRWRTILGPWSVGGRRPMSIRRWPITRRWRTILGPWSVGGWRPITIRQRIITRWRRGHTLGSGAIRQRAHGEQRCGGGNRSAKMAHHILCSVSRLGSTRQSAGCSGRHRDKALRSAVGGRPAVPGGASRRAKLTASMRPDAVELFRSVFRSSSRC
jgi:hypothetical protein